MARLVFGVCFALYAFVMPSALADDLVISLTSPIVVSGWSVPNFEFIPDGHVPLRPDGSLFQMYLAGDQTYRVLTDRASIVTLDPATPVIGPGPSGSFDNNGAWLYSVFRVQGNDLIGFYHAEDTEWPGDPSEDFIAWKSVALATSADNGVTWTKHGQIVTASATKPSLPSWGGNGDHCVIFDHSRQRWTMFYANHFIKMAVSTDPAGAPGTWLKLGPGGTFSEPGLGGSGAPVPGLEDHPGGNPAVHFNTHLGKWVMVWHTWPPHSPSENSLWASTSDDLMEWTAPILVLAPDVPGTRVWYPTVAGGSNTEAGHLADLTYAYFHDSTPSSTREFVTRKVRFDVDAGIGGGKIVMRGRPDPTRRTMRIRSDANFDLGRGAGSADDPIVGAPSTLRVRTAAGCAGPCDTTYTLDGEWRYIGSQSSGRGYRYRGDQGVVRSIKVRPGRVIKITAKGALVPDLAANPEPVDIVLQMAGKRYCMSFGGDTSFTPGKRFRAKNAPKPALCPGE